MIWVLVIVSPIAFFSRIFPDSQRYLFKSILGWDEWWKQFIEWSLLGVIAGFFLYLAEALMTIAPGMISGLPPGQGTSSWVDNPLVDFVNNFLPWMVVLAFLFIGFLVATSTSALGATGLVRGFKAAGTTVAKRAPAAVAIIARRAGTLWAPSRKIGGRIAGGVKAGPKAWIGGIKTGVSKFGYGVRAAPRVIGRGFRAVPRAVRGAPKAIRDVPAKIKAAPPKIKAAYQKAAASGLGKATKEIWKEVGKPAWEAALRSWGIKAPEHLRRRTPAELTEWGKTPPNYVILDAAGNVVRAAKRAEIDRYLRGEEFVVEE